MLKLFQSFTLRSILIVGMVFLFIVAVYYVAAGIYDDQENIGNYAWNEPPSLLAISLAMGFIIGYPAVFFTVKWWNRRKKEAENQQNLKDFTV